MSRLQLHMLHMALCSELMLQARPGNRRTNRRRPCAGYGYRNGAGNRRPCRIWVRRAMCCKIARSFGHAGWCPSSVSSRVAGRRSVVHSHRNRIRSRRPGRIRAGRAIIRISADSVRIIWGVHDWYPPSLSYRGKFIRRLGFAKQTGTTNRSSQSIVHIRPIPLAVRSGVTLQSSSVPHARDEFRHVAGRHTFCHWQER